MSITIGRPVMIRSSVTGVVVSCSCILHEHGAVLRCVVGKSAVSDDS